MEWHSALSKIFLSFQRHLYVFQTQSKDSQQSRYRRKLKTVFICHLYPFIPSMMLWVSCLHVMAELRLNEDPTAHSTKAKQATKKKNPTYHANTKPHTQTYIWQKKSDKQTLPASHYSLKLHSSSSQKNSKPAQNINLTSFTSPSNVII